MGSWPQIPRGAELFPNFSAEIIPAEPDQGNACAGMVNGFLLLFFLHLFAAFPSNHFFNIKIYYR
jgi:hypothetical protein